MRKQCRIWWPKHLSSTEPSSSFTFLFGWFISCSSVSLDIVVAFACDESSFSGCQSSLKEILCDTSRSMSMTLQDKSMFSLLGQCAACPSDNDQLFRIGVGDNDQRKYSTCRIACALNSEGMLRKRNRRYYCGCHKLDGLLEKHRQAANGSNHWVEMIYDPYEIHGRNIHCIPKLHHIHWNGRLVSQCNVHVILYETPRYGACHFSLSFWNSSKKAKIPLKEPKWIDELHQKQPLNDLDAVILAMNSATASKMVFERHVGSSRSFTKFSIICRLIALVWQLLAVSMASLSTIFYIFLQFLHSLLSFGSQSWIYTASKRLFNTTWINIQIRCGQILFWPILLQDNDL
ncbi:hypothetical protein CISIN_1g0048102mg, partial [Citrus sinensis]